MTVRRSAAPGLDELPAIDLYLGSAIGGWALRRIGRRRAGTVFTIDPKIAAEAAAMGVAVSTGDPHDEPTSSSMALSVHYPRIFKPRLLARYQAAYNLHPSLLPWGRGYFPVFWALWEGAPAGATLHLMTERLDAGPIAMQREVPYDDVDTGASLHARVTAAERGILAAAWRTLGRGELMAGVPQATGGSHHSRADFDHLHDGLADGDLSTAELLRLARCLTFDGYPGLAVRSGGVRLRLKADSIEKDL